MSKRVCSEVKYERTVVREYGGGGPGSGVNAQGNSRMVRQEADREDLIKEAVALVPRGEFQLPGSDDLLTAGFRGSDAISLFFGQDPVYQFDDTGALRRAYVDGLLYRSQGTTLARLTRVRTETHTLLQRQDLSSDDLEAFQEALRRRLQGLLAACSTGQLRVVRSIPEAEDWMQRLPTALQRILAAAPWLSSTIRTRK